MKDNTKSKESKKFSLCEELKEDTSEVIKKLESQTPTLFQNYSDLYTTYLHLLDDIYGTCYISETELLEKLNLDPKILTQIKTNSDSIKKFYLETIDMNTKYIDACIKMEISAIKAFDNYFHVMMDSYGSYFSQFKEYTNY